jgi:hypothetical protein
METVINVIFFTPAILAVGMGVYTLVVSIIKIIKQ